MKTIVNNLVCFLSVPTFFNLCINCRNVTKFYKNCGYFATTVPISQTATARSQSFSPALAPPKKVQLRLHNTALIKIVNIPQVKEKVRTSYRNLQIMMIGTWIYSTGTGILWFVYLSPTKPEPQKWKDLEQPKEVLYSYFIESSNG